MSDAPRVSALVDLCNAASLVQAIPVAPFDLWRVAGDCTVRFATGAELFVRINGREFEPIPAGEPGATPQSAQAAASAPPAEPLQPYQGV